MTLYQNVVKKVCGCLCSHFALATCTCVTEVVLHHRGVARGCSFGGGGADTCCVDDTEATAQE